MTDYSYKKIVLTLSILGVSFSGYLSAVKFITTTCAFREPCPYFLGYPSCWYGFAMFFVLFVATLASFAKDVSIKKIAHINAVVSGVGIIFAFYFTVPEIKYLIEGISRYTLGLPTCAYGLIFYMLVFIISVKYLNTIKK